MRGITVISQKIKGLSKMGTVKRSWYLSGVITVWIWALTSGQLPGYIVLIPSTVVRNETARTCITLHGITDDVIAEFNLQMVEKENVYTQKEIFKNGISGCFDLKIPDFINRRQVELMTVVRVRTSSQEEYLPVQRKVLRVIIRNSLTFIQTDKPLYKPGQTVRLRIFNTKMDLTPQIRTIPLVTMETAEGYIVQQWRDVPTRQGLGELEFPLSQETALGRWKISVHTDGETTTQLFSVHEYVLPKFEISIQTPKTITTKEDSLAVRFCAKYTYNKPVEGVFSVSACSGPHCTVKHGEISGCQTVDVNSDLWRDANGVMAEYVHIYVNVTDNANGRTLSSPTNRVTVSKSIVRIEVKQHSSQYFKPGLPYYGKVRVYYLDNTPAAYFTIEVSTWHPGDPPDGIIRQRHASNLTTDERGEVIFTLPAVSHLLDLYTVKCFAYTSAEGDKDAAEEMVVRRWFSPSGNYMQIHPLRSLATCATGVHLNVSYILPYKEPATTKLHYQVVMSNGDDVVFGEETQLLKPAEKTPTATEGSLNPQQTSGKIVIGNEPIKRRYMDVWRNVALIPKPVENIGNYGHVTRWRLLSMRSSRGRFRSKGKVYLQIWRPVTTVSERTYKLVGQTLMGYDRKGSYVIELEGPQTIVFQPTDVVGIFFPRRNPIPFNNIKCSGGDQGLFLRNPSRMKVGESHTFSMISHENWLPCRDYAVQLTAEIDNTVMDQIHNQLVPHHFPLRLNLPSAIPHRGRLLLYYVTPEGETVADAVHFEAGACLKHKVHMIFHSDEGYPGDRIFYELNAHADSLCAVGMVDKSVYLLQSSQQLTQTQVLDRRQRAYKENKDEQRSCDDDEEYPLADTLEAFEVAGITVLSNLGIENRPCSASKKTTSKPDSPNIVPPVRRPLPESSPGELEPLHYKYAVDSPNSVDSFLSSEQLHDLYPGIATVDRRFYFPETWLWDTHIVGEDGKVVLNNTLPHSITEWKGSTICLNDQLGMGISAHASIRAFQPFFLSVSLPYSVIRREKVKVVLTVYSYLQECLELRVRMEPAEGLALAEGSDDVELCVCGAQTAKIQYVLDPIDLGTYDLQFEAKTVTGTGTCSEPTYGAVARDIVVKPIVIKPEGMEAGYTYSTLLCPSGFSQEMLETVNLSLPLDYVVGSERAEIKVMADVMGPTVDGAHKLLREPSGTGEQNLAKVAVNVLALEYLDTTSQLMAKHRDKALVNLEIGYQQQLQYRRREGSYSAFGAEDEAGSLWLTSFVVYTYSHLRRYIFIDSHKLYETITWIKTKQAGNGCFMSRGMVHKPVVMGGLGAQDSYTSLTAYIIAALLHGGVSKFEPVIVRGLQCLDGQAPTDPYPLALLAHAYSVYDGDDFRVNRHLQKLRGMATRKGGLTYWKVSETPDTIEPVDIETTGYVLLAILASGRRQDIIEGASVVRWLMKYRNSKGAFSSTQDTVVAVAALSMYASLTYLQEINMRAWLTEPSLGGTTKETSIDAERRLVVNVWEVTSLPKTVKVGVSGIGCLLAQADVSYNKRPVIIRNPVYALDIDVHPVAHPMADSGVDCPRFHCWHRRIAICTRYTGDNEKADVTIMEIKMISGWSHDRDFEIRNSNNSKVIFRTQEKDDMFYIYFSEMSRHHTCVDVTVTQLHEVKDTKEAYIRIYGHYEHKDHEQIQTYNIEETCTEEEKQMFCLPDIMPN